MIQKIRAISSDYGGRSPLFMLISIVENSSVEQVFSLINTESLVFVTQNRPFKNTVIIFVSPLKIAIHISVTCVEWFSTLSGARIVLMMTSL